MITARGTLPSPTSRPSLAGYANVAEPFLTGVAAHPERAAVICADQRYSYAETNQAINRLCALMLGEGVRPGDKVAYLLPNGVRLIELYYAIAKIGAVAVPLNFRSIAPELAHLLCASDAAVLFFAEQFAPVVEAAGADLPELRLLCVDGAAAGAADVRALGAGLSDEEPLLFRDPEAVSRIQFTGGSTGAPKGAERTHRADLVEFEGIVGSNGLFADEAKVVLIQCPLEHHGGHSWFGSALSVGATLVLCSSFDPEAILTQIERHRVSYMILLPPSTYVRLMAHPAIDGFDLSSVRLVQSSAGGTSPEIVADVYRHFPNAVMNYGWGQTESGLGTSLVLTLEMAIERQPRIHSVGTPMPLLEAKVVDAAGAEVPPGVIGECAVRSDAVMRGYYKQPELTRAAFTADGWLLTGDLMVRDADGYFYLKGRKRELIKSGGENVFIGEVENVVREHPAVLDAMVFGRPDALMGEAVAAAVELRPGATLGLDELQRFCRERLASFKKPRSLAVLDSLDRDFSGKLRREEVIRRCAEQQARDESLVAHPELSEVLHQVHSDPDVYRVVLPLHPRLDATTNAYLVRGPAGWLLVDPGSPNDQAYGTMRRAFAELGIGPDEPEVLLTHEHTDHAGLVERLLPAGRTVTLGAAARRHLADTARLDYSDIVSARLMAAGFAPSEVAAYESLRRRAYSLGVADLAVAEVDDGAELNLAGLPVRVVATPGHTIGHVCYLLPRHGLLFTGDHVLFRLPPALFSEAEDVDLLAAYLDGLDRIAALDVALALPGHGRPEDGAALVRRTASLAIHHRRRLDRLVALAADFPGSTAAGLTAAVSARVPSTWADLPAGRRWSIAATTLARLRHLTAVGALTATTGPDGLTHYTATA